MRAEFINKGVECSFPDCKIERQARGLCSGHYAQSRKPGGNLYPLGTWKKPIKYDRCAVDKCPRPHRSGGYCNTHLYRSKSGFDLEAPLKDSADRFHDCAIADCGKRVLYKHLICEMHRSRSRRYGLSQREYIDFVKPGKCANCSRTSRLAIHHDHNCCNGPRSCGKCVIALLCGQCNMAAGLLMDDPKTIANLAEIIRTDR